jgi:hypothetical protein
MCDRGLQVSQFADFFRWSLNQYLGRPQVYLVHGGERECHDSFVERLVHTRLKELAERKWGEQQAVIAFEKLDWPDEGDLLEREQQLRNDLFSRFAPDYLEVDLSAGAFASLPALALKPVVALQYNLHDARWDRLTRPAIERFLSYWSEPRSRAFGPQVILFLNIIYGRGEWWRSALPGRYPRSRIESELKQIVATHQEMLPCVLLKELTPVRRDDVRDWFSFYNIYDLDDLRLKALDAIFRAKNRVPDSLSMADVERELHRVHQEYVGVRGSL